MKTIFHIGELDCAGCVKKIEHQLGQLEGVDSVKVFAQLGKVRTVSNNKLIATSQIEQAIIQLGYPVDTTKMA